MADRAARATDRTLHLFTVDVEEYFHVSAFDGIVPRADWDRLPSRVVHGTERLLEALARHGAAATFFVLGRVAQRHPDLVRRIAAAGHEVASHGQDHRRLVGLSPARFRDDVRTAKAIIEDATGLRVDGYRAPSFSVLEGMEWVFDVLVEEGHRYDSSLFPIRRRGYGYPSAALRPHLLSRAGGALWEFPLATTACAGMRLPAAGGGYLRHFPFAVIRRAFREHDEQRTAGVFYVHPWEVDPDQPRLPVPPLTRLRHYGGLRRTMPRIERLLGEFRFGAVREWLARAESHAATAPRAIGGPARPEHALSGRSALS